MHHSTPRVLLFCAAMLPATVIAATPTYPDKAVRLLVLSPPGGGSDITARAIAQKLTEKWGQNVIVDNRAGAAGQLGMELGKNSPPDGYTIIAGQGGNMVVMPHTYKKIPYDPLKDFAPIALSTTNFLGLVVHPSVPFKTVKDLVTYAKANPNKITFGSNGEGGFPHMTIELLRVMAGFTYVHVPYKGSAQIATDLIGGHIDAAIDGITGITPHIRAGKLRLLAITNPTRVPTFEGVPTVAESVPGYDSRGWFGFIAPANTPREIVNLLNAEINRAMSLPDVKDKLTSAGLYIVNESPDYFASVLKSDYAKYGKLIRELKIRQE